MKFVLFILTLFLFGCSIEKRVHRPGFHFKKTTSFQPSKKEKKAARLDFKKSSSILKDSNRVLPTSQAEHTKNKDQSQTKTTIEESNLKKAKNFIPSLNTKEFSTDTMRQKFADITKTQEKKREVYSRQREPEEENRALLTIANVLSITSFIFALLTIASVALAFILSLTLILPLLPALAAFCTGGLSLIIGFLLKNDKYKARHAVFGLVTSLLFFGFFVAVLSGVILI